MTTDNIGHISEVRRPNSKRKNIPIFVPKRECSILGRGQDLTKTGNAKIRANTPK